MTPELVFAIVLGAAYGALILLCVVEAGRDQ